MADPAFQHPLILAFIPSAVPYVMQGFEALEAMPDWYQYTLSIIVAASFGVRSDWTHEQARPQKWRLNLLLLTAWSAPIRLAQTTSGRRQPYPLGQSDDSATFPNIAGAMTKSHTQLNTSVPLPRRRPTPTRPARSSSVTAATRPAGTITAALTATSPARLLRPAPGLRQGLPLAGDLTGNVSVDGSANVTLTAAVTDDSHNHVIANVDACRCAGRGGRD